MGTLVGRKYRTNMMARLADHTYVECGTGAKGWGCWGGKTNGATFGASGQGSTIRADRIAGPNERANVNCYLINGVCHQAANRILSAANATVRGARGYWVSTAMYGAYGRPSAGPNACASPFVTYSGVTGDLPACVQPAVPASSQTQSDDPAHAAFMRRVQDAYQRGPAELEGDAPIRFQMELYELLLDYRLHDAKVHEGIRLGLLKVRYEVEVERQPLDEALASRTSDVDGVVREYNRLTVDFQKRSAEILGPADYTRLFDQEVEDYVDLGDPEIARQAYGRGPSQAG